MAWAFAKLLVNDEALLVAIASAAVDIINELSALSLSRAAWAFATLLSEAGSLFEAIAAESVLKISAFT